MARTRSSVWVVERRLKHTFSWRPLYASLQKDDANYEMMAWRMNYKSVQWQYRVRRYDRPERKGA